MFPVDQPSTVSGFDDKTAQDSPKSSPASTKEESIHSQSLPDQTVDERVIQYAVSSPVLGSPSLDKPKDEEGANSEGLVKRQIEEEIEELSDRLTDIGRQESKAMKKLLESTLSNDQQASAAFQLAQVLINKQQFTEALEPLVRALKLTPQNNEIKRALGCVYYFNKDYNKCVEFFKDFKSKKGDRVYVYIAWSYFHLNAHDQAISAIQSFLGLSSNFQMHSVKFNFLAFGNSQDNVDLIIEAGLVLSHSFCKKKKYEEGISIAKQILGFKPNYPAALIILVNLYRYNKQYAECIKTAKTYLELNGNVHKAEIYSYMGEAYENLGKYHEAIQCCKIALKKTINPELQRPLKLKLSLLLPRIGKFDEGFATFQEMKKDEKLSSEIKFENNTSECIDLLHYASNLHSERNYLDEIQAFSRILSYNPNLIHILILRGEAYRNTGNPEYREKAIQDFNLVLKDRSDVRSLTHRSSLFIECERYQEALLDLEQELQLDPAHAICPCHCECVELKLGLVLYNLNQFDRALEVFNNHINKSESPHIVSLIYKGWIYLKQNKYELALQELLKAKQIDRSKKNMDDLTDKDRFNLYFGLSNAYLGCQNYKKALESVKESLKFEKEGAAYRETLLGYQAFSLQKLDRDPEALKVLEMILSKKPDNPEIIAAIESIKEKMARQEAKNTNHEKNPSVAEESSTHPSDVNNTRKDDVSQVSDEINEVKERKQKRQEEKIEREKLKKLQEAEMAARKELEDEIERRRKKFEPHLPSPSQFSKKAINRVKIPKQDFGGAADWWLNEDKKTLLLSSVPSKPPLSVVPKSEVIVVNSAIEPISFPEPEKPAFSPASPYYKPAPGVYRPLTTLAGQPICLSPSERNRLITAERMILGIEDLQKRAYGDVKTKPYYDLTNEVHRTIVKHGFLYYALRALEALHPTGKMLTKEEENFVAMVNNFVMGAEKVREFRHQIRNCSHLITLTSMANFVDFIKKGKLHQNIKSLLEAKTYPKEPKPLHFDSIDLCNLKERSDWNNTKTNQKTILLLRMIIQEFNHMKAYIKPIEDKKEEFFLEGEIQNALKMAIAIIGKCLSILKQECGFKHPVLYSEDFKALVKQGNDVSHKIGEEDLEFYEFDEISPMMLFEIASKAPNLVQKIQQALMNIEEFSSISLLKGNCK